MPGPCKPTSGRQLARDGRQLARANGNRQSARDPLACLCDQRSRFGALFTSSQACAEISTARCHALGRWQGQGATTRAGKLRTRACRWVCAVKRGGRCYVAAQASCRLHRCLPIERRSFVPESRLCCRWLSLEVWTLCSTHVLLCTCFCSWAVWKDAMLF